MAQLAQFAVAPVLDEVLVSSANTARDGTGTLATLAAGPVTLAAAGVGKRINRVRAKAIGTTTAGMLRFFVSADGGTTKFLIHEVVVKAIVPSAFVATWAAEIEELAGLVLPGGNGSAAQSLLYVSTHNAESFHVTCEGGNF